MLILILSLIFIFTINLQASTYQELDSMRILSEALIDQNLYKADQVASEYYRLAENSNIIEARVNSRLNYSQILDKAGNKDLAEKMILDAMELSKKVNSDRLYIISQIELAHYYQVNSRFNEAFENYYASLAALEEQPNDTLSAKLHHYFGRFLINDLNDKSGAKQYLDKSLQLSKKIKDNDNVIVSMFAIAELYRVSWMLDKYKESLDKSADLVSRSKNLHYKARLNRYYGMNYMASEKFEQALPYLEASLKLNKEINNLRQATDVYTMLAYCFGKLNQIDSAITYNKTALKIRKDYGDKGFISSSLINIAFMLYEKGDYCQSIKYAEEGLEIASSIDNKLYIKRAYMALTRSYEEMEDFKNAYKYNRLANAYSDSLMTYQLQKKVSMLETKHKIDLKDKEIQENRRISNIRNNYQILALSLGFVILIFIFLKYKKKKSANLKLKEKNDKIIEQNSRLVELNGELEKLIIIRDKVNSIISHDLVNPLRWIKNFSLTLYDNLEGMSQTDIKSALFSFFSSSQQIHSMSENLVNWGKMQSNGLNCNPKNTDLIRLIKDSASQIEVLAKEKDISIVYELQSNIQLHADPVLIQLLIRNLLTNAIKFSKPGEKVIISLLSDTNYAVMSFQDYGIGMEQNKIKTLFDDPVTTIGSNKEHGTGLGLIICKDIIDIHKGEIFVNSQSGKGSLFTVKLPLN